MSTQAPHTPKARKPFTPFQSVAEEAAAKMERESWDHDSWDNEGGAPRAPRGCIVYTPGNDMSYKVLFMHRGRPDSEHPFATMREAEAFIRRNTPVPPALSKLYDRDPE